MYDNEKTEVSHVITATVTGLKPIPYKEKEGNWVAVSTDQGELSCFLKNQFGKLIEGRTYVMKVVDPTGTYKNKKLIEVIGETNASAASTPAPKPVAKPAPAPHTPAKDYTKPTYPERAPEYWDVKDARISKLSVLSSVSVMLASKVKVDPVFANMELDTLATSAIYLSERLIREFVYREDKPETKPVVSVITSTPAVPQTTATVTPSPAPAQKPDVSIYGVNEDADKRMKERLDTMLKTVRDRQ